MSDQDEKDKDGKKPGAQLVPAPQSDSKKGTAGPLSRLVSSQSSNAYRFAGTVAIMSLIVAAAKSPKVRDLALEAKANASAAMHRALDGAGSWWAGENLLPFSLGRSGKTARPAATPAAVDSQLQVSRLPKNEKITTRFFHPKGTPDATTKARSDAAAQTAYERGLLTEAGRARPTSNPESDPATTPPNVTRAYILLQTRSDSLFSAKRDAATTPDSDNSPLPPIHADNPTPPTGAVGPTQVRNGSPEPGTGNIGSLSRGGIDEPPPNAGNDAVVRNVAPMPPLPDVGPSHSVPATPDRCISRQAASIGGKGGSLPFCDTLAPNELVALGMPAPGDLGDPYKDWGGPQGIAADYICCCNYGGGDGGSGGGGDGGSL